MEYRKLISFGKSSYVVSLPKSWIKQNQLKKGDLIYLEESKEGLILQANYQDKNAEETEIVINVNNKSLKRIQREIIAAYIHNFKKIICVGKEVKTKATKIQEIIQKLVALEIIEQDNNKIVAKDFLNLNDISLNQIVKKMDVISRSMLSDCKNMFKEDNSTSIYNRDQDINKFRYLVYRIVWYGMSNPTAAFKKFNLSQVDLFNYWWFSLSIEQIGDCIKRIARHLKETKLNKKNQEDYLNLLTGIEKEYLDILKAYYANDVESSHNILNERGDLIRKADDFFYNNREAPYIGFLVYNTKALIVNINVIARTIYQGMPSL